MARNCSPADPRSLLAAILAAAVMLAAACLPAAAIETSAPRALIVESDTGTLLFAKGEDEPFAPGNFTKLVTAAVVFDALAAGEIRDETAFKVSEHAWRTGGAPARVTTMFAAVRSEIRVDDLLRGLAVHYANDAAIVLAEGIAGSEDAFARRMNDFVRKIGMTKSRFVNPTGYPDARARTTVSDLARLIDHVRRTHPDRWPLYGLAEFEWNKILQRNKTGFVHDVKGAEGLVLAYDEKDGFGAAVSQLRDGRRILVVASGFQRDRDRDSAVKSLLDAAFSEFSLVTLWHPAEAVGSVRVYGGAATRVSVEGAGPVAVTLPRGARDDFRVAIVYDGPVRAPVARGDAVAALEIREGDRVYQTVPLVASADVPVGTLQDRARDGLVELLFGWWR